MTGTIDALDRSVSLVLRWSSLKSENPSLRCGSGRGRHMGIGRAGYTSKTKPAVVPSHRVFEAASSYPVAPRCA